MRKIYIGGTFDYVHEGHRELFEDAKKIAGLEGMIVLAVNSDEFVQRYKGLTPTMPAKARLYHACEALGNYPHEAYVVNHDDQRRLLERVRPDFVIHGTDWTGEGLARNFGVDYKWFTDRDILFVYTDRRAGVSSTDLRNK